jgi:REP element-mobilizing transposase RayT
MDRLLDEARTGAFYLRQPAIADLVVEAIDYNAAVLGHYRLHAFVIMPNHVHMLASPAVALPILMKSLKGITAKRANTMLGLTGKPFWQAESYDHLVRDDREFGRIRLYIEGNPVRAGLVTNAEDYRWSSANSATGASPADLGSAPQPAEQKICPTLKICPTMT